MKKTFSQILLFSFFGGIVGAFSSIYISGKYLANISETVTPTPTILAAPDLGFWEKIISENSSTSVSIQVFQANKVIRQGSGIIVSSDGLVVTVGDLAVTGAVYQIFYDDKILTGTVAARDYEHNLLLIKTNNSYPNVVDLSPKNYDNGQEVVLVGKLLDFSKPRTYSQRGTISYVTDKNINIDAVINKNLYGYAIINRESDFLGLSYLRNGRINLVRASAIQDFLQAPNKK
ncbi:MAG: serine protease [bacterium]|nr:serine protease [bacterium]